MLDEPTSNLDFGNQVRVLGHIKELAKNGLGMMMTTHFPDNAFLYASRVVLMKEGRVIASDRPEIALTEECLCDAYATALRIVEPEPSLRLVVPQVN